MRNDAALNDICFISPASRLGGRRPRRNLAHRRRWQNVEPAARRIQRAIFSRSVFIDAQPWLGRWRRMLWRAGRPRAALCFAPRTAASLGRRSRITRCPVSPASKFFDRDHGIAFGQSASYAPSGVFTTHDGGNTWQPLASDQTGSWLAGDFLAPDAGAFAGPAGRLATLQRQKIVHSPLAASALRSFRGCDSSRRPAAGQWAMADCS